MTSANAILTLLSALSNSTRIHRILRILPEFTKAERLKVFDLHYINSKTDGDQMEGGVAVQIECRRGDNMSVCPYARARV